MEQTLNEFYEEAKIIFRKLKHIRNERMNEDKEDVVVAASVRDRQTTPNRVKTVESFREQNKRPNSVTRTRSTLLEKKHERSSSIKSIEVGNVEQLISDYFIFLEKTEAAAKINSPDLAYLRHEFEQRKKKLKDYSESYSIPQTQSVPLLKGKKIPKPNKIQPSPANRSIEGYDNPFGKFLTNKTDLFS